MRGHTLEGLIGAGCAIFVRVECERQLYIAVMLGVRHDNV